MRALNAWWRAMRVAVLRNLILDEQGGACNMCKHKHPKDVMQLDHIVALCNGGGDERDNKQTICSNCHSRKSRLDCRIYLGSLRRIAKRQCHERRRALRVQRGCAPCARRGVGAHRSGCGMSGAVIRFLANARPALCTRSARERMLPPSAHTRAVAAALGAHVDALRM